MTHDRFTTFGSRTEMSRDHDRRNEDPATVKAHKAALEALFAPKPDPSTPSPIAAAVAKRESARVIKVAPKAGDARAEQREKLVEKLLAAQGRGAVTKAEAELRKAGFDLPQTQDVQLQLLEHSDESCVRDALARLGALLDGESAKRTTVLDARLRRLEDCAEENETRELATALRKKLSRR
jgi:hypothetical protein